MTVWKMLNKETKWNQEVKIYLNPLRGKTTVFILLTTKTRVMLKSSYITEWENIFIAFLIQII